MESFKDIPEHLFVEKPLTENALLRVLSKLYDEMHRMGINNIAQSSNPEKLIDAVLKGIPKDLNINHSGEIKNKTYDYSKLSKTDLKRLAEIERKLNGDDNGS